MSRKKAKLSVLLLLCIGLTGLQAQEAVPTTGGNASGSGGTVSYTIGQVAYTSSGEVAEGVQQAYEISFIPGSNKAIDIALKCSVFPNPVTNFLKLQIENFYLDKNLTYYLYSMDNKLITTKKIDSYETLISMENLAPAIYYLQVVQTKNGSSIQRIKTFKIIKN